MDGRPLPTCAVRWMLAGGHKEVWLGSLPQVIRTRVARVRGYGPLLGMPYKNSNCRTSGNGDVRRVLTPELSGTRRVSARTTS